VLEWGFSSWSGDPVVPEAEQVISYRVPAFRVDGKTVAGFTAFKNHLSYLPFSAAPFFRD
jgi:uncharacterized protein YdhG (YjbR/CyaY superfamily)